MMSSPNNPILLRVTPTLTDQMDVDIIPEYPIAESLLPGNRSFGAVVNIPLTKLKGNLSSG
jgi:hypothetical protein